MMIMLNVDPEKEARLRSQALLRGQDIGDYLQFLADMDAAAPIEAEEHNRKVLPQGSPEWKALLNSMGQGRTGVSLSIKATSRESIYEDDLR